jgi:thiamine-phosphate pyrophosphorylase
VKTALQQAKLYGIIDLGYVHQDRLRETTAALCGGGIDILQLRAKGFSCADILPMARLIQPLVADAGIPFVINDFAELAAEIGADAVHIGQDDGSLDQVRKIIGPSMLIGRSTHSPAQAQAALAEGFDYIGFGPLFPTPTNVGRPGIGLNDVSSVNQSVGKKIPVFCIGGINLDNLTEIIRAGSNRAVIVSALLKAADIAGAVRQAKVLLDEALRS